MCVVPNTMPKTLLVEKGFEAASGAVNLMEPTQKAMEVRRRFEAAA